MDSRALLEHGSSVASGAEAGAVPARSRDRRSLCAFRLAGECYALEVGHVGEIITVDEVTTVPLAPPGVVGLFNLRGTALTIVDLASVLALGGKHERRPRKSVLVLRFDDGLSVGTPIDGVHAIVPYDESRVTRSKARDEHAAVRGIVDLGNVEQGLSAVLLDADVLKERLDALKFRSRSAERH
ncbi:MAG: chemotaxis protein CheW [Planctomycetes bacterium]|nr:chemotaxis protein CheW [Planctomycetota bacterium]